MFVESSNVPFFGAAYIFLCFTLADGNGHFIHPYFLVPCKCDTIVNEHAPYGFDFNTGIHIEFVHDSP